MSAIIAATTKAPQEREQSFVKAAKRVGALGALTFLAACQSVVPKGGSAPVATPKAPPIVVPADGRHQVALLLPITGPDGDVGRAIANATDLAMVDTQSAAKINLKTYDTALGLAAAANRAVADGNKLILGPLPKMSRS